MAVVTVNQSIQAINNSIDAILNVSENLSEETIRWNPTNEEWSILQIISHLNEAVPYWLNEIDRVLAEPGAQWGRGLQDSARLAAVATPDELNVSEQFAEFKELKKKVAEGLGNLSEENLKAENPHRNFEKFGNKPISFMIEHFLEEHVEKHYSQVQRNLSKLD
jgi:hypothetical protein